VFGPGDVTEPLRVLVYDKSRVDEATWESYGESMRKKRPADMAVLSAVGRKPLPKSVVCRLSHPPTSRVEAVSILPAYATTLPYICRYW
jgi:hypothetical protein